MPFGIQPFCNSAEHGSFSVAVAEVQVYISGGFAYRIDGPRAQSDGDAQRSSVVFVDLGDNGGGKRSIGIYASIG